MLLTFLALIPFSLFAADMEIFESLAGEFSGTSSIVSFDDFECFEDETLDDFNLEDFSIPCEIDDFDYSLFENPVVLSPQTRAAEQVLQIAEDHISMKKFPLATRLLEQALGTLHPNSNERSLINQIIFNLGKCHYAMGECMKSIWYFENFLRNTDPLRYLPGSEENSKIVQSLLRLGHGYMKINRIPEAHEISKNALVRATTAGEKIIALSIIVDCNKKQGDVVQALTNYMLIEQRSKDLSEQRRLQVMEIVGPRIDAFRRMILQCG